MAYSLIGGTLRRRKRVPKDFRRGFDAMVLLVIWMVWKERNERVFRRVAVLPGRVVARTVDNEARLWSLAGFPALVSLSPLAGAPALLSPTVVVN